VRQKFWIKPALRMSEEDRISFCEVKKPDYIPVIETLPGDVTLNREEAEKVRKAFEMALGRWLEWIHDELYGTSLLHDALKEVDACEPALKLLSTERGEG
jgi:hypothetical protein